MTGETRKQVETALNSVKQTYLDDTRASLKQMESLKELNTATTLKYIKKEKELRALETNATRIQEISEYI